MRTGRPVKEDTIYKMKIHVNGTHRYASTQPFTIDEDGKKRYAHKHWGTLDENLRFHPNTTYLYASIEERSKLIFPKEWDLSKIEKQTFWCRKLKNSDDKAEIHLHTLLAADTLLQGIRCAGGPILSCLAGQWVIGCRPGLLSCAGEYRLCRIRPVYVP